MKDKISSLKSTVESLRKQGFKVRVNHKRNTKVNFFYSKNRFYVEETFEEKGGKTFVKILDKNGREGWGVARCNSNDFYDKKIGVAIALERAVANLGSESEKSELDNWD